MKYRATLKKICPLCKMVTRNRRVFVVCENRRHKQKQYFRPIKARSFSTLVDVVDVETSYSLAGFLASREQREVRERVLLFLTFFFLFALVHLVRTAALRLKTIRGREVPSREKKKGVFDSDNMFKQIATQHQTCVLSTHTRRQ